MPLGISKFPRLLMQHSIRFKSRGNSPTKIADTRACRGCHRRLLHSTLYTNLLSYFDDNSLSRCYRVYLLSYTHVASNTFNEMWYLKTLKEIKILKKKKKRVLSEYKHEIKTHVKYFTHLFLRNVLNVLRLLYICTFNNIIRHDKRGY